MYIIERTCSICTSHRLYGVGCTESNGCLNVHGHNWKIKVALSSMGLDPNGMVIDFGYIKSIIMQYDHSHLNDHDYFVNVSPTAENLAKRLCDQITVLLPSDSVRVDSVSVWETENCKVEYKPGLRAI